MNIDASAILALISNLTAQVAQLQQENAELRNAVAQHNGPETV